VKNTYLAKPVLVALFSVCLALSGITSAYAQQPTLSVNGPNNEAVGSFRWLIEEDVNQDVVPGQTCQSGHYEGCMGLEFQKSHMPVVAKGTSADALPNLDPAKRYYISVLPDSAGSGTGFTNGGAKISAGQTSVSVVVNKLPLPTAQIRIFVFGDNYPINGQSDTPEETGLAGFNILLEDAVAGQQIVNDAYGNPLGTTYDPATGDVITMGDGTITTDADGVATIKNLVPSKYGVQAVPPAGQNWIQTTTIEGKKPQDAWVKANEPAYFAEFGPPGPHVSIGFVKGFDNTASLTGATRTTISGQVRSLHNSRPPNFAFHTGAPVPGCWVGLNSLATGIGQGVFAAPCNDDSTFSIQNVPPGEYQLVIWDEALDYIFASKGITVDPAGTCNNGGSCNLLDVPIFAWFARLEQYVFNDTNENGFWDDGEVGMLEQGTNIRMRDGTVYQSFPTDTTGAAPYDQVFPFFAWLVAEVNFDRFKATGATIVTDNGGPIDPTNQWSFGGVLNPQPQTVANGAPFEGAPYRIETGPVLTQAFQAFLGQTNIIMWGKKPYAAGENGGISGIVYYAITRAENDPMYAAAETWEPGIPRIQVALYEDLNADGVIDEKNGVAGVQIADVDNYPFGWADGGTKGPEDFDYNGNGIFDQGDAIQVTHTDSWDDNNPTGCGETFRADGVFPVSCYDGLRAFNQVRPGVFDGGYAFSGIPAGNYIVGTGEHPVYSTLKEEDKNVDFGQTFVVPQQLPPACVGDDHVVAATYTLFNEGAPEAAGQVRKLCDRKQVALPDGKNAAADFFMFTQVPIAGHVVGFILDDATNEFDPNAPTFGEKYAPPYMPISLRDWTGKEISRTYSDRWGNYNALVPSTYTANVPSASGMSPNMITACMNDPGPLANGQIDPYYKRQYSQFCYTLQYMPGSTTYLDTPVVPVAAFTGPNPNTLDCRVPEGTPVIWTATGPTVAGPYLPSTTNNLLTLVAAVDSTGGRDLSFGATQGTIRLNGTALPASAIQSWNANIITVRVPASGNLEIVRADGKKSENGIYVTVGGGATLVANGGSIQSAIDTASPGDLIIVPEGAFEELVIMWKPVRLQGVGAATTIGAVKAPAEKLEAWRSAVTALVSGNNPAVDLLPGQEIGTGLFEPTTLFTEEGPGIIVLGKRNGNGRYSQNPSRIDGLTIFGSDSAGGIVVNAYADNLEISNNRLFGNTGFYSGGIRVGHPLVGESDSNPNIKIHHNYIAENGATVNTSAGGGISLYKGSENYQVRNNFICGNYTAGEGGGVGHRGLSHDGVIANNKILFNQSFNQGVTNSGGGVFIGGVPVAAGITEGSGSVSLTGNLIQGNQAGAGDGGGVRLALVNGADVSGAGNNRSSWFKIDITNNMIVNNMAGLAGGAVSMQDAVIVNLTNNTVVNNNSTATAGDAFAPNSPNQSTAQPAGIVAHGHSDALINRFGNQTPASLRVFSNPTMFNNIVMDNRSFYFTIDDTQDPPVFGLQSAGMSDFAVLGAAGSLVSNNGLTTGQANAGDLFVIPYVNTGDGQVIQQTELTTSIATQPAFDEGGNYIQVNFGPLYSVGDYHLKPGAPGAVDSGNAAAAPAIDIDGDTRPQGAGVDIGADEVQ